MPYLPQEEREALKQLADAVGLILRDLDPGKRAGALNYAIFRVFTRVFDVPAHGLTRIPPEGTHNYSELNEMVGALECCKLELYRRWIGPYENEKACQNGDVV